MSSATEFWLTSTPPQEGALQRACTELALWSKTPTCRSVPSARACEHIFLISRYWLPDVRGNYFWPDLHREVSNRCQYVLPPSEQALTRLGRHQLDAAFPRELKKLRREGGNHCYLELIFSQAGIGKDRTSLIREYLEMLSCEAKVVEQPPAEVARASFKAFMRSVDSSRRDDVRPLRGILLRIGTELLTLIAALRQHAERGRIVFGSWGELRAAWLGISGRDLDSLTPSAAEAIHDFIPKLDNTWTRMDVFRHTRAEGAECRYPDGTMASQLSRPELLPLGFATARLHGVDAAIKVIDRADIELEAIILAERESWHHLKDNYSYRVSDKEFTVSTQTVKSVPLFTSRTFQQSKLLHFWGGTTQPGRRARSGGGVTEQPLLHARTYWRWRAGAFALGLESLRTSLPDGGDYTLRVSGNVVWTGGVTEGRLNGFVRSLVHADRIARGKTVTVELMNSASSFSVALEISTWPLLDSHVLLARGRLYPKGSVITLHATEPEKCRITLLTLGTEAEVTLRGAREVGRAATKSGRISIEVVPTSWKVSAELEEASWLIHIFPSPPLCYPPDKELECSGVRYTALGDIRIAKSIGDARLGTKQQLSMDPGFGFWLQSGNDQLFCPLADELIRQVADGFEVLVGEMAARHFPSRSWGKFQFSPGTVLHRDGRAYSFFVPPGHAEVVANTLGTRSLLSLPDGVELVSDSVVALSAHDQFCCGRIKEDAWEVVARWKPRILDVTINGLAGDKVGYRLNILPLRAAPIVAEVLVPSGESAYLLLDGQRRKVESGERLELDDLRREAEATGTATLGLVGDADERREWTLEARSVTTCAAATVASVLGRVTSVEILASGLAIQAVALRAELAYGELTAEAVACRVDPDEAGAWQATLILRTDEATFPPWCVRIFTDGQLQAEVPVQGKSSSEANSLLHVAAEYRKDANPLLLIELFHAGVRELLDNGVLSSASMNAARRAMGTRGGDVEQEGSLISALDCLQALQAGGMRPNWPIPHGAMSHVQALATSAWLLLAETHRSQGTLDPDRLRNAMDALSRSPDLSADSRTCAIVTLAVSRAQRALRVGEQNGPGSSNELTDDVTELLTSFQEAGLPI